MIRQLLMAILFLAAAAPRLCLADPFIERVWPPVLQRGRANRVEFSGTELRGAVNVWTSLPRTAVTAKPVDPGNGIISTFDVDVPADAPLGIYGLRLATTSGLSNVHLFVVDELPVSFRTTMAAAASASPQSTTLPACVVGQCRKGAMDRYAFDAAAGQQATFEVVGNRLGKNYDPLVTIRDPAGRILAQGDNDAGLFFDCRLRVTFPIAGRYIVEVSDARYEGDRTWSYVLRMGDFPVARTAVPSAVKIGAATSLSFPQMPGIQTILSLPLDHPAGFFWHELLIETGRPATWIPIDAVPRDVLSESEPNNAHTAATPVRLPAAWCGVLQTAGDEDWFQFPMKKGESLRLVSQTARIGSAADLEIVLWEPAKDAAGRREVARNDETTTRDNDRGTNFTEDASLTFTARVDGDHWLQVRDLVGSGGPAHTYRIDAGPNTPELAIRSEVDVLTIPRQSYQPVPLKVTRTGFSGPVELSLVGAPPGVTLEPAVVPEKETELVCRLVVADAAPEGIATIQIVGRAKIETKDQPATIVEAIATTHPLIDRQLRNKDRILYALRADQQLLPPSLTNRIAMQITPPSPFDFHLPDSQVLLPKYQTADFRIVTTRRDGFIAPLRFALEGGQIGDEAEERVQIYARVPDILAGTLESTGRLHNRILTQYQKHRVDVKATARVSDGTGERQVSLTRTFTLDVKPAFDPTFEKPENELIPGESVKVVVKANRVATFDGPVLLTATQTLSNVTFPETIEIPAGKTETEVEVRTTPTTQPTRHQLRFEATAQVGGYQETRNVQFHITVKLPPKK